MTVTLTVSDRLADELRDWAYDETSNWPDDTAYQDDLEKMVMQLDEALPTADDVRGISYSP